MLVFEEGEQQNRPGGGGGETENMVHGERLDFIYRPSP